VSAEYFPEGKKSTFPYLFQFPDDATQMDVHKTRYPFYTAKTVPHITATVAKPAFRWQQCSFFTSTSFHTVSNYVAYRYQQSLSTV